MIAALALSDAAVRVGRRLVLDGAGLIASAGEVVGVVGSNGAGKTTLLRAALGLARLERGTAKLGGREVSALSDDDRARLAGYLPQERRVAWSLPAWRVVALGAVRCRPAQAEAIARAALERVGLSRLAERGVLEMSGGERARVLLARLLATEAPLLVADEPAAGLDPDAQLMVVDLLREEAAHGRAVVVTLHDLSLAARGCDRLVVLDAGRVVADGPPRDALGGEVLRGAFHIAGEWLETSGGPVLALQRAATPNLIP